MVDYNCALLEDFIGQFASFTAVNQNSSNIRVKKKPLVARQAGNGNWYRLDSDGLFSAFAELREASISSSCPVVRRHGTTPLPQKGFD